MRQISSSRGGVGGLLVLSPAGDRSPWNKFLHFLPSPFSHLASKGDGNAMALAAAAFLITHWSRETQISAQLRPFLFPFPLNTSCSPSPFPGPVKPSSFGVIYTTSASEQFLSQGLRRFSSISRMLSTALFSCRWELSEANNLGRRAQGASPGVLAWPCPCQEDEPRSPQVRAPRGAGWPHLEGAPIPNAARSSPGFWQQQLPALAILCLVPDCTFVLSQDFNASAERS